MTSDMARRNFIEADLDRALEHVDGGLLDGRRLFVTGGTGFFGFWLLAALARLASAGRRFEVTVLSRNPERFLAQHPHYANTPWLSFITGDVLDYVPPAQSYDYFVHAATDTSAAAQREPLRIFDTVVEGSRRVFAHAATAGVRRILAVSSGAVYGRFPDGVERIAEDAATACDPLAPGAAYAEGKRAMEALAVLYGQRYGFDSVIARGFAFVGPTLPLDGHFAIGNFIRDALAGGPIVVQGDGSPLRSYLYGADMAAWLLVMLTQGHAGRCYNLGSDETISVGALAAVVRDTLAPDATVVFGRAPEAGPRTRYVPDIARARAELRLAPWTSLQEAITATARWHSVLRA
jgi:dTDP-glucose 4,6-dehydratase